MRLLNKSLFVRLIKCLTLGILAIGSFAALLKNKKNLKKVSLKLEKKIFQEKNHIDQQLKNTKENFSKKLKTLFKDYFLPHQGNNHKPKALSPKALTAYVVVIILVKVSITGALFFIYPNQATLTSKIVDNLYALTNKARADNGLEPLVANKELALAAQRKVDDMISQGYFAHISPDGTYPWQWIDKESYDFLYMGENLAMDFSSAEVVQSAFMNSPTHRDNILQEKYTNIGIAVEVGKINGKDTIVLAEFFGARKVSSSLVMASDSSAPSKAESNIINSEKPKTATLENKSVPEVPVEPEVVETETKPSVAGLEADDGTGFNINIDSIKTDIKPVEAQFEFNGIAVGQEVESGKLDSKSPDQVLADLSESAPLSGAQLVVVDQPGIQPGLVDLLVSWSRNFITLILAIISTLLLVNVLIKIRVQHTHVIVHSLVAIGIIAALLVVRFHTVEKFVF